MNKAISIRAIIRFVASNPRVYQRLQKEIDDTSAAGKLSPIVSFEEGQALPYTQACIKEALRLFPAGIHDHKYTYQFWNSEEANTGVVGYQLPRIAPEDTFIDGVFIPAGVRVSVSLEEHFNS